MFPSEASPEGDRRDAERRFGSRTSGEDRLDGREDRAVDRVHEHRDDGVYSRLSKEFLFPRSEHAAAGRASDHRDGDWGRFGEDADSDRDGDEIRSAATTKRTCD